jgi:hypothetical protein
MQELKLAKAGEKITLRQFGARSCPRIRPGQLHFFRKNQYDPASEHLPYQKIGLPNPVYPPQEVLRPKLPATTVQAPGVDCKQEPETMKLNLIRRLKPAPITQRPLSLFESLGRRGAAALEFAVSLPMLLFLTFGIIETCDAIFLRQSLILAAQEGARVAVVPGATATNVRFQTEIILRARGVQEESITITPANFQTAPFGSMITVSVVARVDQNTNSYLGLMTGRRINGSCTMMMEHN